MFSSTTTVDGGFGAASNAITESTTICQDSLSQISPLTCSNVFSFNCLEDVNYEASTLPDVTTGLEYTSYICGPTFTVINLEYQDFLSGTTRAVNSFDTAGVVSSDYWMACNNAGNYPGTTDRACSSTTNGYLDNSITQGRTGNYQATSNDLFTGDNAVACSSTFPILCMCVLIK